MKPIRGRMLCRDISGADGFAELSPKAAVLFLMILAWLDSHGKLNGHPATIRGLVCPKIRYLRSEKVVARLLAEIHAKTGMKWFSVDGQHYIHAVNFDRYQKLERRGEDLLPSFSDEGVDHKSTTCPRLVDDKSRVKLKLKAGGND